jgi:uncharacterized LabA/DUF88 family protein
MVFVDYSALRASLKNEFRTPGVRWVDPNSELDYEKLGRWLCGDQSEFIRLNLYTGTPVTITETENGSTLGRIELHDHEAFLARGVSRGFQDLEHNVRNRSRYTRLATGRMMARRVELRHGKAFTWAQAVLAESGEGGMSAADEEFFGEAARINQEAKDARDELCRRIIALKDEGRIPKENMGSYSRRLAQLLGEQLDFTEKGVDTKLTVEMLELCMNDSYDDAILFAADEDYVPLVEAVKKTGRHVIQAFWDIPNPGWVLRQACDDSVVVPKEVLPDLLLD